MNEQLDFGDILIRGFVIGSLFITLYLIGYNSAPDRCEDSYVAYKGECLPVNAFIPAR